MNVVLGKEIKGGASFFRWR